MMTKQLVRVFMLTMVVSALFVIPSVASADCQVDNPAANVTTCTGADNDGVNVGAGPDQVNLVGGATVTNGGDTIVATNDLTVTGDGEVSTTGNGSLSVFSSDDSVNNSVTVNSPSTGAGGVGARDSVTNTGDITSDADAISVYTGDGGNGGDSVVNQNGGDVTSNNGAAIRGFGDNDEVNVNGGTVTGNGNAIDTQTGDDTITVNTEAVVNGTIFGGAHTAGDTLQFTGNASQAEFDELNTQVAACAGPGSCAGTIVLNGNTYTYADIETLVNLLSILVASGEIEIVEPAGPAAPAGSQQIDCAGGIRTYNTAEGFVQVYASGGADLFLVAVFKPSDESAGAILAVPADPNTPNWSVRFEGGNQVTVLNEGGAAVGTCSF